MGRRVVVTGAGLISPLGNSVEGFFANLIAGRSGVRSCDRARGRSLGRVEFDASSHFGVLELRHLDRVSQFSIVAARRALASAGLNAPPLGEGAGVFFGTGMGGAGSLEEGFKDFFGVAGACKKLLTVPAAMTHAPGAHVGLCAGVRGECQTYSTACSSSAVALGEAFRRIRDGYLDIALAGGAEALLVPSVLQAWEDMKVLCADPPDAPGTGCRPFSLDRSGFALSEGAAVLVLEVMANAKRRGARPLAEIVGYGVSNDASHITRPDPQGQAMAMRLGLADAGISEADVGYINAHGTATRAGDAAEARAIHTVFGPRAAQLPVSGTKSGHGHLMGATGAVEFLATAMALHEQVVPPTTHWTRVDPECELDCVPRAGRAVSGLRFAMSNSFAFGGNNAVLIAARVN